MGDPRWVDYKAKLCNEIKSYDSLEDKFHCCVNGNYVKNAIMTDKSDSPSPCCWQRSWGKFPAEIKTYKHIYTTEKNTSNESMNMDAVELMKQNEGFSAVEHFIQRWHKCYDPGLNNGLDSCFRLEKTYRRAKNWKSQEFKEFTYHTIFWVDDESDIGGFLPKWRLWRSDLNFVEKCRPSDDSTRYTDCEDAFEKNHKIHPTSSAE